MAKAAAKSADRVKITLIKSANGRIEKHRATLEALGLRRIGDVTVQPNNPATKGKLDSIGYLVSVAEQN